MSMTIVIGGTATRRRSRGRRRAGPGGDVVGQLLPRAGDHVLLKHRYSAFDHTALELLLASLRVGRVLLVGSATEGCVVQTAPDVREHGLKATILVDACA